MPVWSVCCHIFHGLASSFCRNRAEKKKLLRTQRAAARSASAHRGRSAGFCGLLRPLLVPGVPEMVGHLHLQAMDESLKGKNREGLLDSPDSGLPPSPSPPFCSLSPGLLEPRSGSCSTPVDIHHGCDRKEGREGKLVRASSSSWNLICWVTFTVCCPKYGVSKSDG